MFASTKPPTEDRDAHTEPKKSKEDKSSPAQNPQAKSLKASLTALTGLHGKLHGDLPFGKREIAFGNLDAKDIDEIFALFRGILIPLIGMSTITDIFERIAERRGWLRPSSANSRYDKVESWEHRDDAAKEEEKRTWNEVMKTLHEPFAVAAAASKYSQPLWMMKVHSKMREMESSGANCFCLANTNQLQWTKLWNMQGLFSNFCQSLKPRKAAMTSRRKDLTYGQGIRTLANTWNRRCWTSTVNGVRH